MSNHINEAYRDIVHAIEDGSFAVSAGGHVSDQFSHVDCQVERPIIENIPHSPFLTVTLTWVPTTMRLFNGLEKHYSGNGSCTLHGAEQHWEMGKQVGAMVELETVCDGELTATVEFTWASARTP